MENLTSNLMRIRPAFSILRGLWVVAALGLTIGSARAEEVEVGEGVKKVDHSSEVFRPDPNYEQTPYSAVAQRAIYGDKTAVETPRPLFELGRRQYTSGPLERGINLVGRKNLLFPALSVYGDWRTAVAYNDNGALELGQVATRLNLDVDLKLTSTERLHAFLRPLDQAGQFTRSEFSADDDDGDDDEIILDGNLETLFLEGDGGSIVAGITDSYADFDFPFALGLMPLLFQNGVWLDDAFTGAAATIPARNSVNLDISNMDFTFFFGLDKVTSPAILDNDGNLADHGVDIYGVAAFIEANEGYWEAGVARINARDSLDQFDFFSATIAHSRRFRHYLTNSVRLIGTFGQDRPNNLQQTADGVIVLVENSLITTKPLTYIPYVNLFAGFDRPQKAAGADGILKNTGINFETDGLTGFPKLDDTGQDTFGGAIGINYLFALDRQIVAEVATVQIMGSENDAGRPAPGDQYAVGLRYQHPISKTWILRGDAMYGWRDNADDISGIRFEARVKF